MKKCLILVAICFLHCVFGETSDNVLKCPAGDKDCIRKSINSVFAEKFAGDESFGLTQMDPVELGNIYLNQGPKSPVGVNIKLFKPTLYGLKSMKAVNVKGFGKNPEGRHQVLLKAASSALTLIGDYTVGGRILLLPVQGEGLCNVSCANPTLKVTIEGASLIKDDKLYMNVKNATAELEFDRLYLHFDNLFNGDKALGDSINALINDNWQEIAKEMNVPMMKTLNERIYEVIRDVFAKTPYHDLVKV